MSAELSFWSRLTNAFRSPGNGANGHRTSTDPAHSRTDHPERDPDGSGTWRAEPLTKRQRPSMEQLRNSYEQVTQLMDAIHDHLKRQDERSERLAQTVERVAGSLDQLTETQRTQGDSLASIAKHTAVASNHTESLGQLPASMRSHAEAIRSMANYLDVSRESNGKLVDSLHRFGGAVAALETTGTAQIETLQRLQSANTDQTESLKEFIREQNRRFLWVTGIGGLIGLGAIGGLVAALATVLAQ